MWMNLRYPHLLMGPFSINISFCLYRYFVIISGGGNAGRADQRFFTFGFVASHENNAAESPFMVGTTTVCDRLPTSDFNS